MDLTTERTPTASNAAAPSRTPAPSAPASAEERLFSGGGAMGAILAAIDWAKSSLGPVETWPQTLRTSLRICLTSRHDIILWWGPDFIVFYNDAYAPTLGIHHPKAAGRPGREVWAEIWDVIGPMLEGVLRTGQPTWSDDQLLYLERNGYPEETYHTFSYSPIEDDNGNVGGVFTAVTETTSRVLAERRAVAVRDLAAAVVDARTPEAVCSLATRVLATYPNDVPFALLYLLDREGGYAHLAGHVGLEAENSALLAPVDVDLTMDDATGAGIAGYRWPLREVARSGRREVMANLPCWPARPLASAEIAARALPPRVVVQPITELGQVSPSAILVAGVNPHRALDDDYERFYALLASHLASALASAHAYEEERRRAEALAEIDRAKTTFFSNVSHEFRSPLTLMLGPIEDGLADIKHPLPPEQRERQEVVHRNGLRLLKLVNTLLDFARIEAGRVQAVYEPTDLAAYTADLASSFRSLVEKAGMTLTVDCPPLDGKLAEPVYVDREMWERIVLNLLSNAFKFTLEGEIAVSLTAVSGGSAVELTVRDTGVGIPASELPRLFERFHRVEGTRARTHEGSGIGLALVQELVHLHGGTIRAESAEDVGTAFFVRLPAGSAQLPAERVQATPTLASTALGAATYVGEAERWLATPGSPGNAADVAERLPAGGALIAAPLEGDDHQTPSVTRHGHGHAQRHARIVLADDNADMRDYLARLLGEHYGVEAVVNGTQALAAIRRERPDLVISDVMMPELDGFGLLRELRADPVTVTLPVMLLSARAGEEATAEGLEAGADDYLVKPFSAREVLSRVAARLEIARAWQEVAARTRDALDGLLRMAETLTWRDSDIAGGANRADREGIWADGLPAPTASSAGQHIVELTQRILGCEVAGIMYFDRDTLRLAPVGLAGVQPDFARQWWQDAQQLSLAEFFPADVVERMRAAKATLVDLEAQPLLNGTTYGLRHVLLVPMAIGERIMGIFWIEHHQRETPYTDEEVALVDAIARLAALIVERERLLREQAEGQARELALSEANRRMDEFLGIASHELRTPLTSIMANVQLTGRQLRGLSQQAVVLETAAGTYGLQTRLERTELLLERTERQMVRLDRLVGDLLDSTRIQAGKLEMRPEPCDLREIVRDTVREQRIAWSDRSIELDLPRRGDLKVIADPDRIGQVVTNFLTNALKYSPAEQPVTVRLRQHGEVARMEVRDHGPGLTVEQQAHLFEQFYRVPGIEQQRGSGIGLGLGLYICKTIVERHGGHVGVESAHDHGSTFWFTLPLVAQ